MKYLISKRKANGESQSQFNGTKRKSVLKVEVEKDDNLHEITENSRDKFCCHANKKQVGKC